MDTKRCARCGAHKPPTDFYRNAGWHDGLHPYCKPCLLAHQKARREIKLAAHPPKYRWKRDLVRHHYFATIDQPIKAYVLGLLAADGYVVQRPGIERIAIELSAKDLDMLLVVRDQLAPGATITTRTRTGTRYNTNKSAIFAIHSEQMVADLARYSITPAKSRTIQWPAILPDEYAREFILGYYDGDGHITSHRHPNGRIYRYLGITSASPALLISIADAIEHNTGHRPSGPWAKAATNTTTYAIRAAGTHAYAVDNWLHATGLGLARKRLPPPDLT